MKLLSSIKSIVAALVLIISSAAVSAPDSIPSHETILKGVLEATKDIRTAEYASTERSYYTPESRHYFKTQRHHVIECENPLDTAENAKFVEFYSDGQFRYYYDGLKSIFRNNESGLFQTNDYSRHYGIKQIMPPFFNHTRHLCDYLLTTDAKRDLSVIDNGATWTVDAIVHEWEQICFFGKPYFSMSMPYADSHFTITVDKGSMMPVKLSYLAGWPQSRYEEEIADVKINPFYPDDFDINNYLPDHTSYTNEEISAKRDELIKKNIETVKTRTLPADTLDLIGGGTVSLRDSDGKVRLIVLLSSNCGFSKASVSNLNALRKEYSPDDVEFIGIFVEDSAEPEALEEIYQAQGLEFKAAQDNGSVYHHFIPISLAPVMVTADRQGYCHSWQIGFNYSNPEATIDRVRKAIDRCLAEEK